MSSRNTIDIESALPEIYVTASVWIGWTKYKMLIIAEGGVLLVTRHIT